MNDNHYWQAVQTRNSDFDGRFVYAVRSTGIYCRPSCTSRQPLRENVQFFALPEAAEQAGFRACKRCHPRDLTATDPQVELIQRVCRYLEAHVDHSPTLETLGRHFNVSPHHLQRQFKHIMQITPREYLDSRRVDHLKAELRNGQNVTDALYQVGYGSSSRLYERANAHLGMTPATYRKGGEGMQIDYTIVDCPLGRLLVAATERGVCAIYLGDSDAELQAMLAKEYPLAEMLTEDAHLEIWVAAIVDYLTGAQPHLDLPLDLQATAFQRRVWQELQAIPYGETRTYSEIAQAVGDPKATRAVANACASNPVALAIPCHRVVRKDGSLGGYRWGISRKEQLLAQERELQEN